MKTLKLVDTYEPIYRRKGQNLTSVDTKTNSPFYGMITRTKSYVFTEIFLAVRPLGLPFWPAWLMWLGDYKGRKLTEPDI